MTFIYVDGSYCQLTGTAGIGIPHKQLATKVKAKDSLAAELIAVIRGVAFSTGNDVIFTDCRVIVDAVKTKRMVVRHEELCAHLYKLLKERTVEIRWVKRENNRKADAMARLGGTKII